VKYQRKSGMALLVLPRGPGRKISKSRESREVISIGRLRKKAMSSPGCRNHDAYEGSFVSNFRNVCIGGGGGGGGVDGT